MYAIRIQEMTKKFRAYSGRNDRWIRREIIGTLMGKGRSRERWTVLEGLNLQIEQGDIVGLIGRNGSGKSTLLKLIAGILQPTSGRIEVKGNVCSLLELGAGFSPDLTVEENVFLYGTILGLQEKYIQEALPHIISFSELDGFLSTPMKHCSSGMQARLGFAVATTADPDVFLLDEILAVGDQGFRRKCEDKLSDLFSCGRTVVLVSHDLSAVRTMCKRAIWLESGHVMADGPADSVCDVYESSFAEHTLAGADL